MKKTFFVSVIFILLSPFAFAAESGVFTVKTVGVSAYSKSLWITVNEVVDKTVCSKKTSFRLRVQGNEEVYREVMSMALTAKMSGNKVNIGYDEKTCYADASLLQHISIR